MTRRSSLVILVALALGYLGAVAWHGLNAPPLRCALHVHTTASDGTLTDQEMIYAYAARGYDVIAITDHDKVYGRAEGIRTVCGREILVLRGMEHSETVPGTGTGCHVVIIHGIRILAHPQLSGLTREEFQAVKATYYEYWNSSAAWPRVGSPLCPISPDFEGLGKLPIAVDDAHCLTGLGFGTTVIRARLDKNSVIAALKAGKAQTGQ